MICLKENMIFDQIIQHCKFSFENDDSCPCPIDHYQLFTLLEELKAWREIHKNDGQFFSDNIE